MSKPDFEAMAATLESTGEYRVLRKLTPRREIQPRDGAARRTALFVDVETTGLDPERNDIIELAMVPFTYGADGRIFSTGEPFQGLREPDEPISGEITAITGIDHAMVAGQSIEPNTVAGFIVSADLIIAHNAVFDRRFLERFCPEFIHKPWGCSNSQIDWKGEGFEGTRLAYLVAGAGFFYDRHRALNDCYAAIELLATRLPTWDTSSTTWADLMFAESNAMLGSMNELMRMGKPSLCVHDSLIVRLEDQQAAEAALGRNYHMVCGISPGLKVSLPATRGAT